MKKYKRCIGNVLINILIDDSLFEREYKVLSSLFRSYSLSAKKTIVCEKEYFYYIFDKYKSKEAENAYYIICDPNNNKWIFKLMKDLEKFYTEILKCTVIHGSCVRVNDKNILFMGKRWSGKTTLTQYLSIHKNGEYLDDDCIYIVDSLYIGFAMPLPIRNLTNSHVDEYFIAQTTDTDGIIRDLYAPPKYASYFSNIDIVAFPQYGADRTNRIKKVPQTDAFKKIINNISGYGEMKTMFLDIKNLAMYCDCYEIEYSSSDFAHELLLNEVFHNESIF